MVAINNSINNTVGASNPGLSNTLTITNPSNAASSASVLEMNVGGTTAAGPYINLGVGATRSYCIGVQTGADPTMVIYTDAAASCTPYTGTQLFRFESHLNAVFTCPFAQYTYTNIGAEVDLRVVNVDNTNAASNSRISIETGGAAGGDPYLSLRGPATPYGIGIDNSDSDKLKLYTGGTSPSAGTALATFYSTDVVFWTQYVTQYTTTAGASAGLFVTNADNTSANSYGFAQISSGGGTAGDPAVYVNVVGGNAWAFGIDNSINDNLYIGSSASTPSLANPIITATVAGEVTFPLTPAFLGIMTNSTLNVTGDGTAYTMAWDTEVFDQNSDFSTVTGIFTASVTGRYRFDSALALAEIGAGHTSAYYAIVTSNRDFRVQNNINLANLRDNSNFGGVQGSVLCDMDAADTAYVVICISNSTKTIDIPASIAPCNMYLSGKLEC